jgi:mevalonate pyrophosphate decarboxylase
VPCTHESAEETGEREGETRDIGILVVVVASEREGVAAGQALWRFQDDSPPFSTSLSLSTTQLRSVSPSILSADFSRLGQQVRKKNQRAITSMKNS